MHRKIDLEKLKERIGLVPNDWQETALSKLKRFTKIVGGKRTGKSVLTSYLAFRELMASKRLIWVVAPTYELASRVWGNIEPWANSFRMLKVRKADPILGRSIVNELTGSELRIKSADNPKQLKGDAGDLLIVEEAGDIEDDVWPSYLEPFISEIRPTGEKGKAVFIGNASKKGSWFHILHQMPEDEENASLWVPTAIENDSGDIIGSNNPKIIDVQELYRIKQRTPERVWRQEWMAEFISGQGEVFRNIFRCINEKIVPGNRPGHFYYIGVDLAKHQDWTVLTVIDANSFEVVEIDRFNQIDWPLQKMRIYEMARRYNNATVWMDSTGVGDPIFDDLQRTGMDVQSYKLTNASKKNLVEKLALYIEQARLQIPRNEDLLKELDFFTYKMTDSGTTVYSAPDGLHDDMVISLALAVWPLPDSKYVMPINNNIDLHDNDTYIEDTY